MRAFLLGLVALLVAAPAASAVPLVAVTPGNNLLFFDSASPAATAPLAVTGLGVNETIRGLDARPRTGELHAVTATTGSAANSVAFSYVIPSYRVQAVPAGQTAAPIAGWADVAAGWDFNPVVDRARLVNANDENARVNPFNGALSGNDADLTPAASTTLVGAAYDRNVDGAAATTLFAIDRNGSELVRVGGVDGVPSPNTGAVSPIGGLGIALNQTSDAGFDIASDGIAYAALTDDADDLTRLYTIDLATGAATPLGLIGNGTSEVRALAVVPARPAGPTGPAGPAGSAGPSGQQGAPGPAGQTAFRDRLAAAFAADRYRGRARRRLRVRFVTTMPALVTLELRRGARRVARVADRVGAGRTQLSFRRLPPRGRYTLRLTAVASDQTVRDTARLRVIR
jgi:Domain of unknown function (DUF4394)